MRIPFPKVIPLRPLLIFLTVVLIVQVLQGTDPAFALLMMAAQVTAVVGFNRLGGFMHMAGAFCVFAVLPNVTVPEITHLALGQPGDYGLQHPLLTAGVCAVFFSCMMIAALVVSSVKHPVPILDHVPFSTLELRIISILSCILAVSLALREALSTESAQEGSLFAAMHHFIPLLFAVSIMLATHIQLVTTDGESAVNWFVVLVLILSTLPGVLTAGKEGMLTPLSCWLIVVAASGHRFKWYGIVVLVAILLFCWIFVYPFSQNARVPVREAADLSLKVGVIMEYLRDPSTIPDTLSNFDEGDEFGLATSKVNIVQRYSLLKSNDMLIDADERSGYTSIERYLPVLYSVIPHALWPDRPDPIFSTELGHKAGFKMLSDDDTTGISIGSPGMFFDVGGWPALMVYSLLCFVAFFFVAVRVVGNSQKYIWGLVPVGTETLIAGAASPSSMFLLVVSFMATFLLLIGILKLVGIVGAALISRPTSA